MQQMRPRETSYGGRRDNDIHATGAGGMAHFFAAAWLISVPFFLFMFATRRNRWSVPTSGPAQTVLYTIFVLNIVTAIGSLCGLDLMLFGTPLFLWSGFLLLCFFWTRSIYLLCNPVKDQAVAGP
jgi:hypothetical protein